MQPAGTPVDGSRIFELEALIREIKRDQQNASITISSIQTEVKDKVDQMTFNLNISKKVDRGIVP